MIGRALVWTAAVAAPAATLQDESPRLPVGEVVEGEIGDGAALVETATLVASDARAPAVGLIFWIEPETTGPATIELRSYEFDAYLVLRNAAGTVLAEDDDGLVRTHARIVHELEGGADYRLEVCALHGQRGAFELSLRAGTSPVLSPLERARAEVEDARRRVAFLEERKGPEAGEVGVALNDLATLLQNLGEYAEARLHFERALAIVEAAVGSKHSATAGCLNNLAVLLQDMGDLDAALPLLERAMAIREELLGPDDPRLAGGLNNLASLHFGRGDLAGSRALLERALELEEAAWGPRHPEVASVLHNLTVNVETMGAYAEALPLAERALAIRVEALGPEHPLTASSLGILGLVRGKLGEHGEARRLHERALAIREAALGSEHPGVAESLFNLAGELRRLGETERARDLMQRALAINEVALGPRHPMTATNLASFAVLRDELGESAEARRLHERALSIREEVLGPEHPDTAESLDNLADLLADGGRYAEARALYERALAIYEVSLGPRHPRTADCLNDLGHVLYDVFDYRAARPLFERALAICETELGPRHPRTAHALESLGALMEATGAYEEARLLHERALAIRTETLGPDHPETGSSLRSLGMLLYQSGELAAARPLFERALAISEASYGPDHLETATALGNLAAVLVGVGAADEARHLAERALAIRESSLGPERLETAASLITLASALEQCGALREARPLSARALAITAAAVGADHPKTGLCLNNYGLLLYELGEFEEARELLERSLAIGEQSLGSEDPDLAFPLNNLALVRKAAGDHGAARQLHERALAIREAKLGPEHRLTLVSQLNLAMVLIEVGELDEAWTLLDRSEVGRREHLATQLVGMTQAEMHAYLAGLRWHLVTRLDLADAIASEAAQRAAYESLLAWKGQVLRLLQRGHEQLVEDLGEEARALVQRLREVSGRLSALALARSVDDWRGRAARLDSLREEARVLELELRRATAGLPAEPAPTWDAIRDGLPPGSALVDVFFYQGYRPARGEGEEWTEAEPRTERHVKAWLTRGDGEPLVVLDLGPAEEAESAIRALLDHLVARRGVGLAGEESGPDPNDVMREFVWDPLASHLEGVDTVFVCPDEVLATLPLEVLRQADGRHLVEDFRFVYLPDAGTLLRRSGDAPGTLDSLLTLGGVDYRRRSEAPPEERGEAVEVRSAVRAPELRAFTGHWDPLDFSGAEARAVGHLHEEAFPDGTRLFLTRTEATEERLERELPRHAVAHLATHGFFEPEGVPSMWRQALARSGEPRVGLREEARRLVGAHPGLLSGLVCAGANAGPAADDGDADDGYLTADEVGWLDFAGVELIVLSACETGLGRPQSGEGLLGLRRALLASGAKTVISSLWRVVDETTAELMKAYYRNLWLEGMGRHEALRAAQLEMLQRNRAEHGKALPSTWGAFVLSGEWR